MDPADYVGWTASAVLFATICRQVWKQWKEGQREGVSRWLFVGQMTASALFLVYSWMLDNWVFVVTNFFMMLAAIAGELILRTRRSDRGPADPASTAQRQHAPSQGGRAPPA